MHPEEALVSRELSVEGDFGMGWSDWDRSNLRNHLTTVHPGTLFLRCLIFGLFFESMADARIATIRLHAPPKYGPHSPIAGESGRALDVERSSLELGQPESSGALSSGHQERQLLIPTEVDSSKAHHPGTKSQDGSRGMDGDGNENVGTYRGLNQDRFRAETAEDYAINVSDHLAKKASGNDRFKKQKAVDSVETLELPQTPIEILTFNQRQSKAICIRYEGKLVAYYSDIYKIENCKRRPIIDSKTVYDLVAKGHHVIDVEREVIVALGEGAPLDVPTVVVDPKALCRRLKDRYVTYSYVDVYFIEGCKRRLFPDWTTYTTHRTKKGGDPKGTIESLALEEFAAIPEGEPIPSVVDEMFAKLLSGEAGIDVIPVDEACKGLESQTVGFYSRLYKIEKCRKRELVGIHSILKVGEHDKGKIQELSAEKWLSLPDGEPLVIQGADRYDQSKGPPRFPKN